VAAVAICLVGVAAAAAAAVATLVVAEWPPPIARLRTTEERRDIVAFNYDWIYIEQIAFVVVFFMETAVVTIEYAT